MKLLSDKNGVFLQLLQKTVNGYVQGKCNYNCFGKNCKAEFPAKEL